MANAFLSWRQCVTLCLFAIWPQAFVAQEAIESSRAENTLTTAAQEQQEAQKEIDEAATLAEAESKEKNKSKRGSFVVAPIPISNPALGSGLVPVIGYIFPISKKDKVSPPSVVGGAALFTDNGSRAAAFAGQLYFAQNTYKTTAVYARGNLNYDLYGSGASEGLKLPIKQTGQVFQAEFLRRIAWQFFLGPRFMRGNSIITDRSTGTKEVPPPPPDLGLDTALTALGVRLARDTSENRFYPMSGTYFSFTSDFFSEALGSKYSFQSYRANFSKYWNWGEKHVLAYNGYSCSTGGAPPFYGNCIYGSSNQLRGYVPGKYFDRYTFATQLEYRLALPFRLGVVGFGGIGEAIPGDDPLLFMHNDFLPAGGVGVRLLLSRQYHVNLRSDFAWGKDGHTFNLGIGEAF